MNAGAIAIAPSILSCDFARIADELASLERAGADLIHVDVMDGHFVPNLTFGAPIVAAIKKATRLPLDVHLMIESPERWVEAYADAGASWISVHVEATTHLQRTLEAIRKRGVKAGVALNPATPPSAVEWVLSDVDYAVVMTVNPGFGGQKFLADAAPKAGVLSRAFRERALDGVVEVDGGVNADNAPVAARNGARILVAGQFVFSAPDRGAAIRRLRDAATAASAG